MTVGKVKEAVPTGEEIGLKLLQSVREMKARTFARTTEIDVNDVVQARHGTGLSQSEFAAALNISKRTPKSGSKDAERHPVPRKR